MEDYQIVNLFWERSQSAITETDKKYGRMLMNISNSLVSSIQDAEECVNDTYLSAWNCMPNERPTFLGAFLSKIIRRISISKFRSKHRQKRGGFNFIIEELSDAVPDNSDIYTDFENGRLSDSLNKFIYSLEDDKKYVFLRRYFYSDSLSTISLNTGYSESKIKSILFRMRLSLKKMLEEEKLL